jgi:uncharacterized membrane protein YfcA
MPAADPTALWLLALALAASGLLAGFIAGLLGVGGGIVLVPVLDYALRHAGFPPEWCMHVAVATSLATIIPTAISSCAPISSAAASTGNWYAPGRPG